MQTDNYEQTRHRLKEQIIQKFAFIDKDDILPPIVDNCNRKKAQIIFKKIKLLFSILLHVVRYCILREDLTEYHKMIDDTMEFPKDLDELVAMVGFCNDAFSDDTISALFNIVSCDNYYEFYCISKINDAMIPFVADDEINFSKLNEDFKTFCDSVRYAAADVLMLNIDFDDETFIEES